MAFDYENQNTLLESRHFLKLIGREIATLSLRYMLSLIDYLIVGLNHLLDQLLILKSQVFIFQLLGI